MHQRLERCGHEAIVDEEILFYSQGRVAAFQIACAVVPDAVSQGQILRTGRRANRIGLHEPEPVQRTPERRRLEQTAADGKSSEGAHRHGHNGIMPKAVAWNKSLLDRLGEPAAHS